MSPQIFQHFQYHRHFVEYVVSVCNAALLPYPRVFVRIGLDLRSVNVGVFRIDAIQSEYALRHSQKDLVHTERQFILH